MSFSNFLKEFFTEKQIDAGVYESYLVSILEDNTDDSEKVETLTDILLSFIDVSINIENCKFGQIINWLMIWNQGI
jgi:hypothetical protein